MLVNAQLGRELYGFSGRGAEVGLCAKDASASETIPQCDKQDFRLTVDRSRQEAVRRETKLCASTQEVDKEDVEHVRASKRCHERGARHIRATTQFSVSHGCGSGAETAPTQIALLCPRQRARQLTTHLPRHYGRHTRREIQWRLRTDSGR